MKNIKKINRGYALLETVFYICLFAILSIAVINSMATMTKAFKETAIQAELMQGGNILERISREIRASYGIDPASTNTDLKLNTKDNGGASKTMEFKFINPNIQLWDAGSNIGNLNTPNITVINLTFTQISTVKGSAVKIFLTVKSNHDSQNSAENFYDTIVLRGDY